MTAAEELVLVNAALTAVYQAQAYSINGRNVTKANLSELLKRKKELETQISRESGGSFYLSEFQPTD